MKYLLSIYANTENWAILTPAEQEAIFAGHAAFQKEITDSGEFVYGAPLADPGTAQTVTGRAGETRVVDGPFAESKEHLAGYYLVDCDSQQRAVELAAKMPDTRIGNSIEVRALLDMGGQEM